jgi:hypothetical protein
VPNIIIAGAMNTLAGSFDYVYACIKRREVNSRQRLHSVSAPAVLHIDHIVAVSLQSCNNFSDFAPWKVSTTSDILTR